MMHQISMKTDFCVFILSHGRPSNIPTLRTLKRSGYTGKVFIVVDDEDDTRDEYINLYGDQVIIFDKKKAAKETDVGDNFANRKGVIYARNACFAIAESLGLEYFIQLDDDYIAFVHKLDNFNCYADKRMSNLDGVFSAMLEFYKTIPALSIAMAQTGDFMGGEAGNTWEKPSRKCMNSFICSVKRPFKFLGRINEDTTAYTRLGSTGGLFLTTKAVALQQKQTQKNSGGMTDLYLDNGTYVKSFYSVMYHPSSVKVAMLLSKNPRIHHKVKWRYTVPKIIPENLKKLGH